MTIQQLKNEIRANIYENGNGHITGQILQDVLIDMATKIEDAEGMAGRDGVGVDRIVTTRTSNDVTRVTIYLDNGDSTSFDVRNGRDGTNGRDGAPGRDGMDGRDGSDGANGRDGRDGKDGADGADGRQGVQGARGAQGPAGQGYAGSDGVQGPAGAKGEKGDRGEQGTRGVQGPAGSSGGYGNQGVIDDLEAELEQFRTEVTNRMNSISNSISTEAANSVAAALNRLNLTADSLSQMRTALQAAADNAQSALDRVRGLEGLIGDGGEIDMSALEEALAELQQFQDWLDDIGDGYTQILADYDEGKRLAGQIGYGYDPARGLFTWFGESISTISGTVGTVRRDMVGQQGLIRDIATYYDSATSAITSAWTAIDAMHGRIENVVEIATNSAVTKASSIIDAQMGEIRDSIQSLSGTDLTDVIQRLSAVDASYDLTLDRLNTVSGNLNTVRQNLEAASGSLVTSITKMSFVSGMAYDMRETWNQQSGMLRTVADLTVKKDGVGNDIYWYIPSGQTGTEVEKTRVYYRGVIDNKTAFSTKSGKTLTQSNWGNTYYDNVYPDYLTGAFSYINQKTNSIELGVSSGAVLAAFNMTATPDGSKINMTADRINMDAEVFAHAISAKTAMLGGICLGYGVISAHSADNQDKWVLKDDGTGYFTGDIVAKSLTLGSQTYTSMPNGVSEDDVNRMMNNAAAASGWGVTDMGDYVKIDWKVSGGTGTGATEFMVDKNGLLTAKNAIISGSVWATDGYFAGKIEGASINIGNGSIKFGDEDTHLIITNEAITVDYVPVSKTIPQVSQGFTYTGNNWYNGGSAVNFVSGWCQDFNFTATGNTNVTIPRREFKLDVTCQYNNSTDNGSFAGPFEAYTYYWTSSNSSKVLFTSGYSSVQGTYGQGYGSFSMPQKDVSVSNGLVYYFATYYKFDINLPSYGGASMTCNANSVLVPATTPPDYQQVRIGRNGIQIFLGSNSFYFTAANRATGGPIIALGGKVNGTMRTLKLDSTGFVASGLIGT